jgi:hypothetical protein
MAKRKSKIVQGQGHFSAKLGTRTTTNCELTRTPSEFLAVLADRSAQTIAQQKNRISDFQQRERGFELENVSGS